MNRTDTRPKLMVITHSTHMQMPLPKWAEEVCSAGGRLIQLREKHLDAAQLYELASTLRRITLQHGATLLINDRADVAWAVEADGVVVPELGLPIEVVRKLHAKWLIAKSVHDVAGAKAAEQSGADFLIFGHVFKTASKPNVAPRGLEALKAIAEQVKIPVFAIGGITAQTARQCLENGAFGVAVMSEVALAENVGQAVQTLLQAIADPVQLS
jgi:thiamine-phosphate pyrophosphorylase